MGLLVEMMTSLKKKYCLLLTGTLAPENVPNLVRSEITLRENDYVNSLQKWLSLGVPVVFVENSAYPSERINVLFANRADCEYLTFKSTVSFLGKSHGEAEIVTYAFAHSNLIKNSEVVVKVTGRLFVINALPILRAFDTAEGIAVMCWLKDTLAFADSRFFVGQTFFFENYLLPELANIDESKGIFFEHITARATYRCLADGYKWRMFPRVPFFSGYSGTEGVRYRNDVFRRIKRTAVVQLTNYLLKLT